MSENQSWGQELADLRRRLDDVVRESSELALRVCARLEPGELGSEFGMLTRQISEAQSLADRLSDRLHGRPLGSLSSGRAMSREEFHLLVAMGVLPGGSYSGDAYTDFQMLRYEDEQRRTYINLEKRPPAGTMRVHLGPWPEELSWDRLRPEQQQFFDRYLPEVALRFRRHRAS